MRFLFHAMLGFSIAIVLSGMAYGAVARGRSVHDGARRLRPRWGETEVHGLFAASVKAPEAVTPKPGEVVAPGARLAWHLAEGTDGAEVELSSTPTFEPGSVQRIDVNGQSVPLPASVGAGTWYWRVRGVESDEIGDAASAPRTVKVVTFESTDDPGWG